ncbi:diguanylate cyclase (GGDEF) domain-containing protein [Selenomonas ruminantium]|uniref:Diguanylate cyclase (GGDEF) domain-containing protein n=1 Tax=Selenomonas ruminantium TaxID=971 RepID=A0A1M6R6M4_SELRU|nr:GGDEF domain-containing protein [Selenomonas ruminantium]SHK28093.1 diguanylate cyclase (GGDEF) domain-containing protein [Selenomonas ruminantium]
MYYCLIDLLALLVLLITNHDVFFTRREMENDRAQRHYRYFLYAVILYYVTDLLWGWLYEISNLDWIYLDTEVYFIVMAAGVLLWLYYVVIYLGIKGVFRHFLTYTALILLSTVIIGTLLNRWWPVMFYFDAAGVYHAGIARNLIFVYQVVMLLMLSMYTLVFANKDTEIERKRHLAIGLSGLIMMLFIAIQVSLPHYPLYAISYMLGCCLLRTFVIENEREEYRKDLEIALEREKEQFLELKTAWKLAYTDPLTGVKSKLAYAEQMELIDKRIERGDMKELAVAVFDVNNLKWVNDNLGHDVGDEFIKQSCHLICSIFKKSPVYRVGGDEFVAILEREDYMDRDLLLQEFNQEIERNRQNDGLVIAAGLTEYIPNQDNSFKRIFERADSRMYERKHELKS